MKRTKYRKYQDYVIRDGRLVGEFEEMYRDFDDPWEQTSHVRNDLGKIIGLELLKKYRRSRALEYGCGLGHYTNLLHVEIGAAAGVDISETAIAKATQLYAGPSFFVGDVLSLGPLEAFSPDVLVFSEITWYVLEKLDAFKRIIASNSGIGFLHILEVYPARRQQLGKEYFVDLEDILRFWSDAIEIDEWGQISRTIDEGGGRTFFYGRIK